MTILLLGLVEATMQLNRTLVPTPVLFTLYDNLFSITRPHAQLGWCLLPDLDVQVSTHPEYSYRVQTVSSNELLLGFRDDRNPVRPWAVAIGDSFTEGKGVDNDEAWPEVLARSLNRDVLNMGVPGFSTLQNLEMLKRHGLRVQADIVLFLVNFNDHMDNVRFRTTPKVNERLSAGVILTHQYAVRPRDLDPVDQRAWGLSAWVAPLERVQVPPVLFTWENTGQASGPMDIPDAAAQSEIEPGKRIPVPAALAEEFALLIDFEIRQQVTEDQTLFEWHGPTHRLRISLRTDGLAMLELDGTERGVVTCSGLRRTLAHRLAVSVGPDGETVLILDGGDQETRSLATPLNLNDARAAFTLGQEGQAAVQITHVALWNQALDARQLCRVADWGLATDQGVPTGTLAYDKALAGWKVAVSPEGFLTAEVWDAEGRLSFESDHAIPPNRWSHVAVEFSADGACRFFIDGSPAGHSDAVRAFGPLGNDGPLHLGGPEDEGAWFGRMSGVRLHEGEILPRDLEELIAERATGGKVTLQGALAAEWLLDSAAHRLVRDQTGRGNVAKVVGVAWEPSQGETGLGFDGRGFLVIPEWRTYENFAIRHRPMNRRAFLLYETLRMLLRAGAYAETTLDVDEYLAYQHGQVDLMFRRSAIGGPLVQPRNNSRDWNEGLLLTYGVLDEARAACQEAGVKLVVVLSASKEYVYWEEISSLIDPRLRASAEPGWHWQLVSRYCRSHGIDVIELGPSLRAGASQGEQLYFRIDPHWNELGHVTVATAIVQGLRDLSLP